MKRRACSHHEIKATATACRKFGPALCERFLPEVEALFIRETKPAAYRVQFAGKARRFKTVPQIIEARDLALEGEHSWLDLAEPAPDAHAPINGATVDNKPPPVLGFAEPAAATAAEATGDPVDNWKPGDRLSMPDAYRLIDRMQAKAPPPCFEPFDPVNDRAAWLEWRRGGLGGSDVAALLGLSPWASPFDVWLSKIHGATTDDNAAMTRGRRLESAIGAWAAEELSADLLPAAPMADPDRPWLRGTPDGYLMIDGARYGLEIKTARNLDQWGEPGSADIPPTYRAQVAWYMALTKLDRFYVAVFATFSDDWRIYIVDRDLEVEAALLQLAGDWWDRHVTNGERPPLDGSPGCAKALQAAYPDNGFEPVTANDTAAELVGYWLDAKEAEAKAKAERLALEAEIKDTIGNASGLDSDLWAIKWSRYESKRLDAKALRKARPDLAPVLDEFSKITPGSRLNFKRKDKQ